MIFITRVTSEIFWTESLRYFRCDLTATVLSVEVNNPCWKMGKPNSKDFIIFSNSIISLCVLGYTHWFGQPQFMHPDMYKKTQGSAVENGSFQSRSRPLVGKLSPLHLDSGVSMVPWGKVCLMTANKLEYMCM